MELLTRGADWNARAVIEEENGDAVIFAITALSPGEREQTCRHVLRGHGHQDYVDLFSALAQRLGTREPGSRSLPATQPVVPGLHALLTRNLSPDILYGYGDPAVLRVGDTYHLVVTSNDAPQSFPILTARTLDDWQLSGFAFPRGAKPAWTATGEQEAEYWAPELHTVDGGYLLCFAAREPDGTLGIGLATAEAPTGPFRADPRPLLSQGVVDPHVYRGGDGALTLFWKEDGNAVWPSLLSDLLHDQPVIAGRLFTRVEDVRTAHLTGLLWPWLQTLGPMERFQAQQPLIEAAAADFTAFRDAVGRLRTTGIVPAATLDRMIAAMRTVIRAQPLDAATRTLTGTATVVLENDLAWEGHLVEGVWLWREHDAFYLFYAANDFATANYGIGVACGSSPFGPFVKQQEPLLRSTNAWLGLGHPSVAVGPDGRPHLFLHGYRPGAVGYKEFRALLTVPLRFEEGRVLLSHA